jgi:hypothetical protein
MARLLPDEPERTTGSGTDGLALDGQRVPPCALHQTAVLERGVAERADAVQIAAAIVSTWRGIDAALCPIIGRRGVIALYRRSISLASHVHPWLAGTHEGDENSMDLVALNAALAGQSDASAATAGDVLLRTFEELLTSLVGSSLTKQLVRSVWAESLGLATPQENRDER